MFKLCLFTLVLSALAPPGFAAERFSGQGSLAPSKSQSSADQRFRIIADLKTAPASAKTSNNGRFSIVANLLRRCNHFYR